MNNPKVKTFASLVTALVLVVARVGAQTDGATGASVRSDTVYLQAVDAVTGQGLEAVAIVLPGWNVGGYTARDGRFVIAGARRLPDTARYRAQSLGYVATEGDWGSLRQNPTLALTPAAVDLRGVTVRDAASDVRASSGRLRDVEGTAIYAGRKTELILPDHLDGNLAVNNAREIYKSVAGLTVWESDAGGLQLSVGARGLDPNRTSNFNTRQNGFDISADALGYPESYYTPPAQALARIELVRGAASLQYGTQFGGLLNFKLKEGPTDRKFTGESEQTLGSYGLFTSFNAVGGTVGKVNYYAFGQYKRGDGWRENAGFEQATAYLDVHYAVSPRLELGVELTRMRYLAQQPGGLLDFEFDADAQVSKRARNWFRVNWGLAALHLDYRLAERTKLNVRTFALAARREALGELGPINRPDPLRERDLVDGQYRNFGQEGRLLHRYTLGGQPATLLLGYRAYWGMTHNRQGLANDGAGGRDVDFRFNNPGRLERSDFDFPSRNYAVFVEQLVNLGPRWSLTPGLRAERIVTNAEGYYTRTVRAGNEVLLDEQIASTQRNARHFILGGLGVGYRYSPVAELYANASQNYRAINFSDLVVVNPNLLIDSALADERGYNVELGWRGSDAETGAWRFDVSLFYLRYANRIGLRETRLPDPIQVERLVSLRTNVGAANVTGVEAFGEVDVLALLRVTTRRPASLRPFVNASVIRGRYVSGGSAVEGRAVELIPPVSLRTGVAAAYGRWRGQVLVTHVARHFSDATNAERVADATRGTLPAYTVLDLSAGYTWGAWRVQTGVNNAADARYFTRRAQGYPGPGIIPAEARTGYVGLRVSF